MKQQNPRRLVVKVGTSTLTRETGSLNLQNMEKLARVLSDLEGMGYQVVLVSNYLFPALMVIFALLALGGMVGPGYCLLTGGIWLVFTLIYHLTALKLEAGSKAI